MTEKQQLIRGWQKRIKWQLKMFAAMKAEHRDIEKRYARRIKLGRMQLAALQKKGK